MFPKFNMYITDQVISPKCNTLFGKALVDINKKTEETNIPLIVAK